MAVRIRLKKMGRKARPFFRVCAVDSRAPRDGKVIEELGTYDPMVRDTDARVVLKRERVDYWLGVGAQPSEKVGVLIKKYGTDGTHVAQQTAALEKLKASRRRRQTATVGAPAPAPEAAAVETPAAEAPPAESPAPESPSPEAPASEAPTAE
ncbi:MAG TPA: 30S ribosomal protein S16 [Planctomycetaceae bacterium]|nr:30S ribosomal protein S16 [Planctomycetaceae bacterium]